jgi:hypothetical protein
MPRTTLPHRSRHDTAAQIAAQFRYARFTPERYNRDRALMVGVDQAPCVTFKQFRDLARRRGWSIVWVAGQMRGEVEDQKHTAERIMKTGPAETLIPYTSLLVLYNRGVANVA